MKAELLYVEGFDFIKLNLNLYLEYVDKIL